MESKDKKNELIVMCPNTPREWNENSEIQIIVFKK